MSPLVAFGIAFAGGAGAGLRWLIDVSLWRWRRNGFPWAILLVNAVGCLVLAFLTAVVGAGASPAWFAVIGAGLLGGFTTYSTVSVDTAQLWRQRRHQLAIANVAGTLVVCITASAAGTLLGLAVA
ncbi:fluoride efflux transporter FluC [Microbacterium karelineae]|uniref:fluoride efflux transporter FluC n=1 Tax=Microbacterium karelineae TaxID=2654283 RepID=UPI0018D3E4CC|nr:CrcB family protein [Microbacterium karelineae]